MFTGAPVPVPNRYITPTGLFVQADFADMASDRARSLAWWGNTVKAMRSFAKCNVLQQAVLKEVVVEVSRESNTRTAAPRGPGV